MENKNRLLDDLLNDFRLKAWVEKGEYEAYWTTWKLEHQEDLEVLEDARAILLGIPVQVQEIESDEIDSSFNELRGKLKKSEKESNYVISISFLRYAAAVALIIIGFFIWNTIDPDMDQNITLSEQTKAGELKNIDLPDSTHVVLNGNSALAYYSNTDQRRVELKGEAHFKVQRLNNQGNPWRFVVNTPDLDVEVLGTTFSVGIDSIWTTIVLEEGQVSLRNVSDVDDKNSIFLMKPGEKVVYNSMDGSFTIHPVDAISYNSWTTNKLSLVNRSVEELVRWFSSKHAIEINLPDNYENRELSGSVDMGNKDTAVKMIAVALGLNPVQLSDNMWEFK